MLKPAAMKMMKKSPAKLKVVGQKLKNVPKAVLKAAKNSGSAKKMIAKKIKAKSKK